MIETVEKKYAESVKNYRATCRKSLELAEQNVDPLDEAMANKNRTSVQTERKQRKTIQRQKKQEDL